MDLRLFDIVFYVAASFFLLIGLLLMFYPGVLIRMQRLTDRILLTDSIFLKRPRLTGFALILASVFILFRYLKVL